MTPWFLPWLAAWMGVPYSEMGNTKGEKVWALEKGLCRSVLDTFWLGCSVASPEELLYR